GVTLGGGPAEVALGGGGAGVTLGGGGFDPLTGRLARLFGLDVEGPRLELWRAPVDNDQYGGLVETWRQAQVGMHRMTHRVDAVETGGPGGGLTVRTRVAPASSDLGMRVTYRWTADGDALELTVDVKPEGGWLTPIPRLGVAMSLPAELGRVTWFGRGPGEAYPDTGLAARVGRWTATVEELQTPYVFPQENGHRADVRWAELTGPGGRGVRVSGDPLFGLTVRRWTTADLERARHRPDLVPGDRVHVNLDHAQQGVGTASCGPGTLPAYELRAEPVTFRLRFAPI
ncbi:beta-galactosidase small subunit, partial [Nonomuraea lactucae]|uniref:beta-galactosidase small subunit n=1 Tax=Nonomuraea lactucae TaxID=2249762 RepID=UPI001F05161E